MCHRFYLFLFLLMKTLPTVTTFADTITQVETDGEAAFGALIAQAVDVQEIDVGWTRSKQLWKPLMARGVFGGQVRKDNPEF
jgi:acyl-CoA thioesterase 8